ncbi:MAG: competence type IV pilus minor pilin ComGF [Anaerobacillus sp.]|uniref:competence type IV pilus minor pilin ComGF n=1 Tax=Anaerobacillus sp. TaxID=1872506 RepID=UPI003919626B
MKKNNGFTLIEVLLAFSIFLVIASFIPQFVKLISDEPKHLHNIEVSLFFQQFAIDIQKSAKIDVANNVLYLQQENNEQVTYAQFQQRIRRQVNQKGQEIALQKVADVHFQKVSNGIDVTVVDLYNQTHVRRITHLLPIEALYYGK